MGGKAYKDAVWMVLYNMIAWDSTWWPSWRLCLGDVISHDAVSIWENSSAPTVTYCWEKKDHVAATDFGIGHFPFT